MRISDWSSDVCSSDLEYGSALWRVDNGRAVHQALCRGRREMGASRHCRDGMGGKAGRAVGKGRDRIWRTPGRPVHFRQSRESRKVDVVGKGVSVRVTVGGCLTIEKQKKSQTKE